MRFVGACDEQHCESLSSLRMVGEYTNENGPFDDDHFLVFVFPTRAFEIPERLLNVHFYNSASTYLGCMIEPSLAGNTSFRSQLLWPSGLGRREFIRFQQMENPFRVSLELIAPSETEL